MDCSPLYLDSLASAHFLMPQWLHQIAPCQLMEAYLLRAVSRLR